MRIRYLLLTLCLLVLVAFPVWAENLTVKSGTAASNGDNELVAAPDAGNQITVYKIQVQNETNTSTTAILKSGSTAMYRVVLTSAGAGIVIDQFSGEPKWKLAPATALNLNLSGANSHNYTVWYTVERMR